MTTSSVSVPNTGTTKVATHTISEDAVTKHLERTVPSTSSGAEILPATEAKQDTAITALGTISTSLGTIDGHVDGIETLLGTTNTNTGATTTAITDISKAEDAVHTSGDKGIMALAVRKDTAAAQTSADGDYSSLLTDGNGRLYTAAALYLGATAVTAGAGAVASGTPRVTLASDDPAVAALVAIRDATTTINVAPDTAAIKNGAT